MDNFYPAFSSQLITTPIGDFEVLKGGTGTPVLFLHGYPQTHVIFHKMAPLLTPHMTMILTDLRGYGSAPKPVTDAHHSPYAKREMARDMIAIMEALGYQKFAVIGHDRGGRVAHRLARDYPDHVTHLSVLDIAPTLSMYEQTDQAFATAYYHWFFLIQPAPLPETMIGKDPAFYLSYTMAAWSGSADWLTDAASQAYLDAFSNPEVIHASCEDYRAAASIDLDHDRQDRHIKLSCPVQVLWGDKGFVGKTYDVIAEWQQYATHVTGRAVPGGHFLPEEAPQETAQAILSFLEASHG